MKTYGCDKGSQVGAGLSSSRAATKFEHEVEETSLPSWSGALPPHIQGHAAWPCAELHCNIGKRRPLSGDGAATVQKVGSVNEPQQSAEKKQCHRDRLLGLSCHRSREAAQIKKRFGPVEWCLSIG